MAYYEDNRTAVSEAMAKLPPAVQVLLSDDIAMIIDDIGNTFGLTMGEIGEICELVRQVMNRELKPVDFEAVLNEKLDEDNREKTADIVSALSEKVFSKLLPALGIKVPIEFAVRVGPPRVEGLEVPTLAPARPAGLKQTPMPQFSENETSGGALPMRPLQVEKASIRVMPEQPRLKPPIMETSHERMSERPLESLMKMVEGRVTANDFALKFEKLPDSLKSALESVDSAKKVVDIGRKHALHIDKIAELGAETGMVILGFTHPGQFISRLTRRLGLSEEKVRPVAQEINTEVFLKIREALKQINGEVETGITPKPLEVTPSPDKYQGSTLIKKPSSFAISESSPIPIKPLPSELSSPDTAKSGGQTPEPPRSSFETTEPDEILDRDAILRDIENPTPVKFERETRTAENIVPAAKPAPVPEPSPIQVRATSVELKPKSPPRTQPPAESKPEIPLQQGPSLIKPLVTAPVPLQKIPVSASVTRAIPAKPILEPEIQAAKPKNIVDQKLSGTTTSGKSESRYSSDPYREATE